ncbi:MAG: CHAD domain-containing protein, partial [Gammaproteobacteria bacterium]|nr:CHAD domain-containing protein [Gammaproteobacteria bacterium]
MEYERTWRVEESSLESSVWADIVNPFTLQLEQRVRNQYQLLDTFEGGIWKQGDMLLYNSISGHRGYELWKRADFLSGLPLTMAQEGRKKARFWWEFATQEGNPFQEQIKSACKLRALLEVHSFNLEKIRYAVKNEDLKSVAWLELITLRNRATDDVPESSRQFVRILPLRGYDHELKKLQKKIQQMGLPPCSDQWLEKYLVESGIEPSAYHAKPSIPIEADDPVRDMVLHYIRTLLDIARVNEAGIIEDIDIEFLHDYRVSLRKIRSILSLVRNIFSSEQTRWLKREFAAIAKRTNHLRDLDVYLLEQENYREMVPAALSDGVDELFTSLVAARKRELSRVRRWLRSTEYRNAIEKLQLSLAGEGEVLGVGDKAEQAVITVARREFSKKFHKVGKLGSRIDASTPDEEVHDLRIECKK